MSEQNSLGPILPGRPFPLAANRWNKVFEATRRVLQETTPTPPVVSRGYQIWIANNTGSPLVGTTVVGIGALVWVTGSQEFYQSDLYYAADENAVDNHAILLQTIPDGETGPAIVLGIANAAVSGTAEAFAQVAAGGGLEYTATETKFRVLDSHSGGLAKILLWPVTTAAGSGSSGSSCCCPDGSYKLGYPDDYATDFPTGITTDQKTAFHSFTQDYDYSGVTYQRKFEILSEISESIMKDGSVLREKITITFTQTGPQHPFFYGIGPQYWWPSDDGVTADGWELVQVPDLWTKVHRAAYKEVSPGGGPHLVATNPAYKITAGIFDDTGTNVLVLEFTVRSNDVSDMMQFGRIGLDFGAGTINRFFLPCVDGEPDTGATSGGGPGGVIP